MSVCVVALEQYPSQQGKARLKKAEGKGSPIWVANDEERDVFFVGVAEDFVGFGLDHVAVCEDQLFPVECFLAW